MLTVKKYFKQVEHRVMIEKIIQKVQKDQRTLDFQPLTSSGSALHTPRENDTQKVAYISSCQAYGESPV